MNVNLKITVNVDWGENILPDVLKKRIVEYKRNYFNGVKYPLNNILINKIIYRTDHSIEIYYTLLTIE